MIKRKIYNRLLELLHDFRIVYIAGPRQAGKSTLAKVVAKDMDSPDICRTTRGWPCTNPTNLLLLKN